MRDNQVVKKIKKNGYSSGDSLILTESQHQELERIIDRLFEDSSAKIDHSSNAPVLLSLIGVDPRLDILLEEILTHESVKSVLSGILGDDYKIWEISARYSEPGDNGLGLHQDAWGQMNLAFALNNQRSSEGSTSFLNGSHVLPRWANFISWARPSVANLFTVPLTLSDSDYAFFINKTWHSRRKNRGSAVKKILLFGFFPNGGKYKPLYQDVIQKINPSCNELIHRLNLDEGILKLDEGFVKVVSKTNPESVPYSAEIENRLLLNFLTPFVYFRVILIESFFRPLRMGFSIFKLLFKR
ncbi:phytanoyl-CoA dioxygenase [Leptospira tipperaryensis]|uniref:Phytanoyl-CoA dioxygenase n=1 Tax=Leptospira tipperaryensis TaxID=2564040 RepID=A0A1D7UVU7_9LEPT|nr:putative 2OG-Fe(II) oxygenase [Leptospira tipperaryensis]AOP33673.1 phytanoyl-CoA dioxygenase [Leptospira tipperaryensis]